MALRSTPRNSRHRASSTSSSNTPSTSNTSTATPSSVVNACAVRIDNPASATAPAIQERSPGRSAATTSSSYVPGFIPGRAFARTRGSNVGRDRRIVSGDSLGPRPRGSSRAACGARTVRRHRRAGLEQVPDRVDPLGELPSEPRPCALARRRAAPGHELAQQCLAPRGPCRGARRDRVGLRQQGEGGKAVG